MVELILADAKKPLYLEKRYETDMAEGLKMMALEGHGVAFLPESAVTREVKLKQLARVDRIDRIDNSAPEWEATMEIRLYRERPTVQRPGKPVVARLWAYLLQQQEDAAKEAAKNAKRKTPAALA